MRRAGDQATLFDKNRSLPNGFVYRPDFLSRSEEIELIGYIEDLPLAHGVYDGYSTKRRHMNFGWSYDFKNERLVKGPPLPPFLRSLQRKVAKWLDIPTAHVVEALITEYTPGCSIGWHRDNEMFESIVGISLAGWCYMRLRPLASRMRGRARTRRDVTTLPLEQRSAYLLQRESRWLFQHSIPTVETLRYSITLRTLPTNCSIPKATKSRP